MSTDEFRERIPLVPGAVAGAAAWLLGYLFTYVLTAPDIRDSPARRAIEFFGGSLPTWKVVGWVFFNAQFVYTTFEGALFGGARSFVGGDGGFTPLLYAVPPLLLVAAGLAVARASGAATDHAAVLAGLAVVPAYLVLSLLGIALFAVDDARPDSVAAAFLAGLVYPALFGVVGAIVGARTQSSRATSSPQCSNP
jgi:hypothetical protein